MFEWLNGTQLGAVIVHITLPGFWLCGTPLFVILTSLSLYQRWYVLLTMTLLVGTRQLFPVREWPAFRRWLKELRGNVYYDRCELILGAPVAKEKTMLCYHPHGVLGVAFSFNGILSRELEAMCDIDWFVASGVFFLPLFAVVCGWLGTVKSADSKTMRKHMSTGKNCGILPGGFEEATIARTGEDRVFIKRRKGFVKFALRFGYNIQPVYSFGESDTFLVWPHLERLRLKLNLLKIPGVIFFGNTYFPPFPRSRARLVTVIGDPIPIPHISEPSKIDVDKYHALYVDALEKLFDKYKAQAGYPDRCLQVF